MESFFNKEGVTSDRKMQIYVGDEPYIEHFIVKDQSQEGGAGKTNSLPLRIRARNSILEKILKIIGEE